MRKNTAYAIMGITACIGILSIATLLHKKKASSPVKTNGFNETFLTGKNGAYSFENIPEGACELFLDADNSEEKSPLAMTPI